MNEMSTSRRWLSCYEAAELLGVSHSTIRRWLNDGKIDGFKVGGVVRVDYWSFEKLVRTHSYADVAGRAECRGRQWWPRLARRKNTAA